MRCGAHRAGLCADDDRGGGIAAVGRAGADYGAGLIDVRERPRIESSTFSTTNQPTKCVEVVCSKRMLAIA